MYDKYGKEPKRTETSPVGWVNMRYVSLVCLTLQTTLIIILYSYSRIVPKGSPRYLSSTVVVLAELIKLFFCLLVIFKDSGELKINEDNHSNIDIRTKQLT